MSSNRRAVTLHDVVMGKKGIRYSLTELVTILTHYDITPASEHRRRKLALFQQLHNLDHDRGGLTIYDRRRILSGQMPRAGAVSIASDAMEESEAEPATEPPTPYIKPERSTLPVFSTCSVCLERYTWRHFPKRRITAECNHEPTICLDCLQQAIDSQIETRSWDKLACPLCPSKLSFEAVKAYSSPESFEKYDRHATMHALSGVPNFCMCLGPGCDSGQVHASGNRQPIMTCKVCHFKTCFTHQMPWHEGMTCTAYDQTRRRQNEENDASLALLHNVGMVCPSCSISGIKVSGCDHMTCPRCSYEYCARCLASYEAIQKGGNAAHGPNCPYHSSRLPSDAMAHPQGFLDANGNLLPWEDEVEDEEEDEEIVAPLFDRMQRAILNPQRRPHPDPNYRRQLNPNYVRQPDPAQT